MNRKRIDAIFMPIPDAPDYAINEQRVIINRRTGKPIKHSFRAERNYYTATVFNGDRQIKRSVETFYRQALNAYTRSQAHWKAIPSTGGRYEIAIDGAIRNAATKKVMGEFRDGSYVYVSLFVDGKPRHFPVKALYAEVYPAEYRRRARSIKVQLSRDGAYFHFDTIKACAKFLTKRVFFCEDVIRKKMHRREHDLFGYCAKYF